MSSLLNLPGKLHLRARNLLFEIVCGDIQKALTAAGIPMLLLKGPHVGMTVYDDSTERLFADLDILVRPEYYHAAAQNLLNSGFRLFQVNRRRLASESTDYQLLLRSPRGIVIELHRALADTSQFRSDIEGFFQRSKEFMFGELAVRGLGTEDLLMHLCLHFGKRHFMTSEKKHLLDIALLLKKKDISWPDFLARVRFANCCCVAFYCLLAVRAQHGAAIPAGLLASLKPNKLRRKLLDKFIDPRAFPIYRFNRAVPGFRERMVNLLLLDHFRTMLTSTIRFAIRSVGDRMLVLGWVRRVWLRGHPLGKRLEEKIG